MTPYALFAVAWLAPVAVAVLGATILRRQRHQRVGGWRLTAAVASSAFLLVAGLAVAGWTVPDGFDALPEADRRAIGPALAASLQCGRLPFARVVEAAVDASDGGPVLRYTCAPTLLGVPRFTGEAECADGAWSGPGIREPWRAGRCVRSIG